EALAAGPGTPGSGALYEEDAGEAALGVMDDLTAEAPAGGPVSALDYRDLFTALTRDREVRQALFPHADVLIWGTQEARVQGADLLICAGLNEGAWPAAPEADPWLNRRLRAEAGLRLPDRVIGLSAHDFQQAAMAPEVWLTRARRDAETDTVPSRWLNRLVNLLDGASDETRSALEAMKARGDAHVTLAERVLSPEAGVPFAPRPAPAPPAAARPDRLSVTEVETLIRDPYAIYAKRVLRLRALDPLRADPDARLRGTILHDILHRFVDETRGGLPDREAAEALLMQITDEELAKAAPFPAVRLLWRARMERVAGFVLDTETALRALGSPDFLETTGTWPVPGAGVTLTVRADRLDLQRDGTLAIYDYKSGSPPTPDQERAFSKQLWIEALMAEAGAFEGLAAGSRVGRIGYVGLGSKPQFDPVDVDPAALREIGEGLARRLAHMRDEASGFPSRRSVKDTRFAGDYDQLARHGEWDEATESTLIPVGREGAE
ncbi:double-strand break repair protein AddB, partial [Rhodobacterales bacterium HKCCSP123]|nr:double-strand break repair protein AddB [Rhodobacterales bacterium HKCCSP123]